MSVECLVFIIGIFVQMYSGHVWQQFSIGRFISGMGVGALSITIPMVSAFFFLSFLVVFSFAQYQAETAPRRIRGTFM
jgi:SP family sugar:H+ symporter-like MFS transporter